MVHTEQDQVTRALSHIKSLTRDFPENIKPNTDSDWFTFVIYNYIVNEDPNFQALTVINQYASQFVNSANDGGIDMLAYDEKSATLNIIQTKYSSNFTVTGANAEISKIMATIQKLHEKDFSNLSNNLKEKYNDLIANSENTSYAITLATTSEFDKQKVLDSFSKKKRSLKSDDILKNVDLSIFLNSDLNEKIKAVTTGIQRVREGKITLINAIPQTDIDRVQYISKTKMGAFVSAKASSIKELYDQYEDKGLFDLNVRKYIRRAGIDSGIIKTIQKDSTEFWFLNNGLTIATSSYEIDGNVIHLYDFSVVNGAQTTTLIANNLKGDQEFAVPVKVIAPSTDTKAHLSDDELDDFFSGVSEATNSQKPIRPQDLKANTRELRELHRKLKERNIFLKIKQGVKPDKKYSYTIKIEDLAKIIYSFVNQLPGTARSNVRSLFDSKRYDDIFIKPGYTTDDTDSSKIDFIQDLVTLYFTIDDVQSEDLKFARASITGDQAIFSNGKLAIMPYSALFIAI
ncbi:AIPR family protein [Secundilactobacillus similis]|uniref:AIPR family protein n=1 Tax=Secundilactobacillus similis TaxID=414682 RepID=UPI0006D16403|nr:AIPR family protein [Secundilactobacillus similis]